MADIEHGAAVRGVRDLDALSVGTVIHRRFGANVCIEEKREDGWHITEPARFIGGPIPAHLIVACGAVVTVLDPDGSTHFGGKP